MKRINRILVGVGLCAILCGGCVTHALRVSQLAHLTNSAPVSVTLLATNVAAVITEFVEGERMVLQYRRRSIGTNFIVTRSWYATNLVSSYPRIPSAKP